MSTESALRVVHLDHTSADGGAEYALIRMCNAAPSWLPTLVLPRAAPGETDIFAAHSHALPQVRMGPRQPAGASRFSVGKSAALAARLVGQAATLNARRVIRSADLVHANSTRSAVYGALALTGTRLPYVIHLRDMITREAIGAAGFRLFTTLALHRADGVIANSDATLSTALPYITAGTLVDVIPSPPGMVSLADPPPTSTRVRTVGMVARIDRWKGQDLLIRAFARASLEPDSRLLLAGGSPFGTEGYLRELHELVEDLGIADRVEFLGHVGDVAGFVDDLDIAVQCSTRPEPLGQNVLQYLSRGAVTIASGEGGPAEWIVDRQNGLLFTPRDEQSLATAIRTAAHDPNLRARLSAAALSTPGLRTDHEVTSAHGDFFRLVWKAKSGSTE